MGGEAAPLAAASRVDPDRRIGGEMMTNPALQTVPYASEWLVARPGESACIRLPAAITEGMYSVVEIVSAPGDGTPLHVHRNEDEHMLVLEGTVRVARGDEIFDVTPGTALTLPRNVPHAWGNRSTSNVRMVFIAAPGGVEEALRLIAEKSDIDMQAFAKRFRVDVLGETPF
jgi:mannose-6-phosphate isomerase-like protein (cupin superfamily)